MQFEKPKEQVSVPDQGPVGLRSEERSVVNSVIGEVIFRQKRSILDGSFALENTTYWVETIPDQESETLRIVVRNSTGAEIYFFLDEEKQELVGDYRDYKLTPEQVTAITQMATANTHQS
jgi:hypothetical protein